MMFSDLSLQSAIPFSLLPTIAVTGLTYLIVGAIYRLYFSPLAHFPGPKLGALTFWYEFYYDVSLRGQYLFEIKKMHEIYGPIVRINPEELHIITPQYYEELFAGGGQRRDKWQRYTKQFGTPDAAFGTFDHNLHRLRRNAMNPFFSKASVRRLQPLVQERVDKLLERIKGFKSSGEPLTISLAFTAFSSDIVSEYSFGRSYHRLEQADFDPVYAQSMHEGASQAGFNRQILWPFTLLMSLPPWLVTKLVPDLSLYLDFIRDCETHVKAVKSGARGYEKDEEHPTIFHELLEGNLPPAEKSVARLVQEAQIVVSAGTETTARCLSVITYHLLANPEIVRILRKELEDAIPRLDEVIPLAALEQLPYLTACIQEGLRLSYGVSSRLQRISPDKVMLFNDGKKNWEIPAGTPTSMTAYLVHHDESIFPASHEFQPQRWLDNPRLDRYMVSFSKGSRQCAGINLSYAELYLALAGIFRRYGVKGIAGGPNGILELFETTVDDVAMAADMWVPFVKEGSKGVRVWVK